MIKGNKGEWSEIYTLLKVISDGKLYAGDSNLKKIDSLIFPVVKVLRSEVGGAFEFAYDEDLVVIKHGTEQFFYPVTMFRDVAKFLLIQLQEKKSSTFPVPEVEAFMNSFNSYSLKARSSIKSDIKIVIHDHRTSTFPELGFSIKSKLGGASTLFNASKTTNFIYEVQNVILSQSQIKGINQINSANKIKDRIQAILRLGGQLKFIKTDNINFENNLILIDSGLPKIVSEMLLLYFTSNYSLTSAITSEISETNPLNFNSDFDHPYYRYKVKKFLTDIALGMMPSKVWTGTLDATGGYLIVKKDGDVLCYHIYNRNEFEDYLFNNTKFETPSSTRHNFGSMYTENGKLLIRLNLQIRFL